MFSGVSPRRGVRILPIAILAALLLIGLVFFLVSRDDRPRMQVAAPTETAATNAGYAGALTDLAPLIAVGDKHALEGREVAFEGVQILQVLGDRTFLIGPGMSQKALVVWQPEAGAAANEPLPKIDVGDTVAIHGVVQPLPASQETLAEWRADQLSPADRAAMQVAVVARTMVETVDRSGRQ